MRTVLSVVSALCLALASGFLVAEDGSDGGGVASPFFAFDNGTGRGRLAPDVQAEILKQLGYAGIGYTGTNGIPEMLQALDAHGLRMFSTYVGAQVGGDGPSYDPQLKQAMQQLRGRDTLIWLTIRGGQPSATDLDDQAVQLVREIAEVASENNLRVALYPHTGFYVARVEDALRMVQKVDRANVGASFNLCHWLKTDGENLTARLEATLPQLFAVSINGADQGNTKDMGWDRLIQTLDRGSFDVTKLLKKLEDLGYEGPIGLQCYNIKGDERENLKRSMRAWRGLSSRISGGSQTSLVVPTSQDALLVATRVTTLDKDEPANSHLVEIDDPETAIPVQWIPSVADDGSLDEDTKRLVARIPSRDDARAERRFRLDVREARTEEVQSGWRFEELNDTSLRLLEGDRPVWVYNHGVITNENVPETDGRRSRACYIHPFWGLNGEVLTDDFPKDHWHHHGIFWTWPHVLIDEKEYDLWFGRGIQQRFVRWICRESGPLAAVLAVENGWFVGDQKVMIERVWMRTYRSSGEAQSLDLEFTWIPVGKPITLWGAPGKSYGGLTMRFAPREDTAITVPEGRTEGDLKETSLEWADMTARYEDLDHASGAAIFVHPEHPDYPPTWLTRHYGALCIGWPGVKSQTFEPGQVIRTSYRVWTHRNEVSLDQLRRAYAGYTAAAAARWD